MLWNISRFKLDPGFQACVMGIVNVTPDSFSDGGRFFDADRAVDHALQMLSEGAVIIDIGGESTRPGAEPVAADEEMKRVLPVIERLVAKSPDCIISIDTSKAAVARAAMKRGAAIINDVTALTSDPGMLDVAVETGAGVILVHMQGTPRTMQLAPHYDNPVAEVRAYLSHRYDEAVRGGIEPDRIALDAGIGFGKTLAHNLILLQNHAALAIENRPSVVGISRKAFLGKLTGGNSMDARLWPALALTALLRQKGARIFRTHDVEPTVAALRAAEALLDA